MRYDDFDEYKNSRSSAGSSRKGSSSRSGDRDYYRDRDYRSDYDRGYDRYDRGYDRDYDRYDRGYDRDYDRGYDRDYGYRGDRYDAGRSSGQRGSDFDLSGWARTSPRWEERDRKKRSGSGSSSRGSSGRSSSSHTSQRASSGSRSNSNRSSSSRGSSGETRRSSSGSAGRSSRRPPVKQKRSVNWIPAVLGLVLIIVAVIIIKNMIGGGSGGYDIEFSTKSIVLGETAEASITGIPEGENPTITWSSNDNNVVSATASDNGRTCSLTAKSEGQATIAATVDGETVSGTVMVVKVAPGVVKINLTETEATIKSGETYTLKATVVMEKDDMTPAKISWVSNDASVARVSEDGVITARDVGETIIKGTAGEQTVEFVVTVVENPNVTEHDGTQTTGQEPENGADTTTETGTGTTDKTNDKTNNKTNNKTNDKTTTGSGSQGTTEGTDGTTTGDTDLGSDVTGESPVTE